MTSYNRENVLSKIVLVGIVLTIIGAVVNADVTPWKECPREDNAGPVNCTIHELRVNPCKEAAQNKPCRIKRGLNASIEFEYTTNFVAEVLEANAYWAHSALDLPFLGLDSNACLSTPCPITAGERRTYQIELPISKKYPVRTYDVKWNLSSPEGQSCCFIFQIKIHK